MSLQKMCLHVIPDTSPVAQKKLYAHTDFEKSEGTLALAPW